MLTTEERLEIVELGARKLVKEIMIIAKTTESFTELSTPRMVSKIIEVMSHAKNPVVMEKYAELCFNSARELNLLEGFSKEIAEEVSNEIRKT